MARHGAAVIGRERAEFTFSRSESEVPTGMTSASWHVGWVSPRNRASPPMPDALSLYLSQRTTGETIQLKDADGRPVDVLASAGGEPPSAVILRGPPAKASVRDGQLVFVVEGAANVAALFPTIPDSVMLSTDLATRVRLVVVVRR